MEPEGKFAPEFEARWIFPDKGNPPVARGFIKGFQSNTRRTSKDQRSIRTIQNLRRRLVEQVTDNALNVRAKPFFKHLLVKMVDQIEPKRRDSWLSIDELHPPIQDNASFVTTLAKGS